MKVSPTPSGQSPASTKAKTPEAGGKPVNRLLNLNTTNLPKKQSVLSRKITATDTSHSFQEAIQIISLRDAILSANTPSELNKLKSKAGTLASKEETERLQALIQEQHAKITW